MQVKGPVEVVFSRENKGKRYYSMCVKVDGTDTWFGCGLDKPGVEKGDDVEFTAEADGKYWKVNPRTIKVVTKAPPPQAKSSGGWNDPDRQKSIVAQSSVKSAIDFVALALANDALVLGTATAKPAKKFEVLEEVLAKKAREFYEIAMNPDGFFGEVEDTPEEEEEDDFVPIPE